MFGLRVGYSSPLNALQALPTFTYSPCRITVGQYFGITAAVKLLAAAVFSLLVLALSNLARNPVLNYLAGLALFGANLLLSRLDASRRRRSIRCSPGTGRSTSSARRRGWCR